MPESKISPHYRTPRVLFGEKIDRRLDPRTWCTRRAPARAASKVASSSMGCPLSLLAFIVCVLHSVWRPLWSILHSPVTWSTRGVRDVATRLTTGRIQIIIGVWREKEKKDDYKKNCFHTLLHSLPTFQSVFFFLAFSFYSFLCYLKHTKKNSRREYFAYHLPQVRQLCRLGAKYHRENITRGLL